MDVYVTEIVLNDSSKIRFVIAGWQIAVLGVMCSYGTKLSQIDLVWLQLSSALT